MGLGEVKDEPSAVSRAQRSIKRSAMVRCRPGTAAVRGGPGSAMHRFALHRIREKHSAKCDAAQKQKAREQSRAFIFFRRSGSHMAGIRNDESLRPHIDPFARIFYR